MVNGSMVYDRTYMPYFGRHTLVFCFTHNMLALDIFKTGQRPKGMRNVKSKRLQKKKKGRINGEKRKKKKEKMSRQISF